MKIDNIEPQTPTEIVLLNEIKKLRVQFSLAGLRPAIDWSDLNKEMTITEYELPKVITLYPSAEVIASVNDIGDLRVIAKTKQAKQLGFSYYISQQEVYSTHRLVDMLMDLHKRYLHEIADKFGEF